MKKIALILLLTITHVIAVGLPEGTKSVKAYLFDCTLGSGKPLSSKPLLDKDLNLSKGVIGNPIQISDKHIKQFLGSFTEGQEFLAAGGCHVPHHGLVFYDKEGKAIGYFDICFECGNVSTSVKSYQGVYLNLATMKTLFRDLGFPILKGFKDYSDLYNKQKENKSAHTNPLHAK